MLNKKAVGKLAFLPKGKLKTKGAKVPAEKTGAPVPPALKPGDSKKLKGMS